MKFPESWLRTLVNPSISGSELAHSLTMAGLEVENIEPAAPDFNKVVVAEILSVNKHPDADRLNVCQVSVGGAINTGSLQIVCGANNVHAGAKVPCALIGAHLPNMVVKKARIRGTESFGMLCSASELGILEEATGLLLLPEDAPNGEDFRKYYDLDDTVFTLKLTPNRADCLGLLGISREVAAIFSEKFTPPEIKQVKNENSDTLDICIDEPSSCPLYCGRLIQNIDLGIPTPAWIERRLERSGINLINAVVDVINYVMLETGQPMHAFNLAKITNQLSGKIYVRFANPGEKLQLLNGEKIILKPDMLLIADEIKPLALAGIMGGDESKVGHGTTDLFLESAFFLPKVISGKHIQLGISSDSAHRFERGVDFGSTRLAMERATRLIIDICGGHSGPISEIKGKLPQRKPIILREKQVQSILGIPIKANEISEILQRLQFEFLIKNTVFHVTPPTYRFDLTIEEDLIEEVARIYGYHNIPAILPSVNLSMLPSPETIKTPMQLRRICVVRDYQEVTNYAFVDLEWEKNYSDQSFTVMLKNPISSQLNAMRSNLIGGLVSNLQFNLNRKQTRVRIFEIGSCFLKEGNYYNQSEKLAGLCYGDVVDEQWGFSARNTDFYDVKSDVEALFWPESISFKAAPHIALHPGKSSHVFIGNKVVGWLGELHPVIQQKLALSRPVILFELDVNALVQRVVPKAGKIPKYPSVRRDIAVIVDENISVDSLLQGMNVLNLPTVIEISLFDIYRGSGVVDGKKSLAFRVLLQDTKKTLTDVDADLVIQKLINILETKFQAKLRD
ncbi:MAG: phenylalanine--tRNA ligase subunit beta [Nitrosomonadaceae bacterium]|nr:phenylalanine--tRNA ligase subunit beta [Nitrosomonadaceae bacterium]|tara:strand:+ start:18455 stop:20833 length:2379 start_codon:yes stop_codon:yes gene_type:complete